MTVMRVIVLSVAIILLPVLLFAQDSLDHPEEVDWFPVMERIVPPEVEGANGLRHTFGHLRTVHEDDSVLVACSSGPGYPVILRSTDFGASWSVAYDPGYRGYPDILRDAVSFRNGFVCYVFSNGRILISRDAGLTWTDRRLDTLANIHAVDFVDDMNGMIRWGVRGVDILHTTDGGITWDSLRAMDVYVNGSSAIVDVAMMTPDDMTFVRNYLDSSWIYASADRGRTWSMTAMPVIMLHLRKMGDRRVWGLCNNYLHPDIPGDFRAYDEAWKSKDAGRSWQRMIKADMPPPWGIGDALSIEPGIQIAGGSMSKLYFIDHGTWKVQKPTDFGLPAALRNIHRHRQNRVFGTIGPDFFRMTYVLSPRSTVDDDERPSSTTTVMDAIAGSRLTIDPPTGDGTALQVTALDGSDATHCFSIDDSGSPVLVVHHTTMTGIYAITIGDRLNGIHRMLLNVR